MYAIISELDPLSSATVNALWQELCEKCGLQAIYKLPTPHFSWLLADQLDHDQVAPIISQITDNAVIMTLHTFGIGVFTGENPVLYLPIVKTHAMITLHEDIWKQIQPFTEGLTMYYSPKLWVPHITLALYDLNCENLSCAISTIACIPIELFITVDNLSIVKQEEAETGQTIARYHLSGTKES